MVWSQDFRLGVTRETVIRFSQEKIRLQIWNSKDHLSGLARLERLRTLRLPQVPGEDAAELRGEFQSAPGYASQRCVTVTTEGNGRVILRWHQDRGSKPENHLYEKA